MTKSKEEMEAERKAAEEQLKQILNMTRPKNLQEGMSSGVSNILGGAIGGVGVAVLLPTLGMAAGAKNGGLVGAAFGVTFGAVAGAIGAAGLIVGGAISGVTQIARGFLAVPDQITAPMQGKWWNEIDGQWVKTYLDEEKAKLVDIPEDDSDLIGEAEKNIDEQGGSESKVVKDPFYYECLEVPTDAETSKIKRQYYKLAKQYHPDRNPGDKEAADKFKNIAEAYQVLSDPELRSKYNELGREGLSADKTSALDTKPDLDPKILFAFLFGGDQFHEYIGTLATATGHLVGDSPMIDGKIARTIQKRRVARIALALVNKIKPWVESPEGSRATVEEEWKKDGVDLSKASYGFQMVTTIAKVYSLVSAMYTETLQNGQGLPSLSAWAKAKSAEMEKTRDEQQGKVGQLKAGMDMMKLKLELQQKLAKATTPEEETKVKEEIAEAEAAVTLQILWTTAVVDITSTLYEACHMVFFDHSVDKEVRQIRVQAVGKLGEIWMATPEPAAPTEVKTAKQLYDDAAFAAMLETVKRKDEAAHQNA